MTATRSASTSALRSSCTPVAVALLLAFLLAMVACAPTTAAEEGGFLYSSNATNQSSDCNHTIMPEQNNETPSSPLNGTITPLNSSNISDNTTEERPPLMNNTNTTNATSPPIGNVTSCNLSITITTAKEVYTSGEQIIYNFSIEDAHDLFQIEYWIEDLFGEIIRKKTITKNTNPKSYTPSIDVREKTLLIKAVFFPNCTNETGTAAKQVLILNPDAPLGREEDAESLSSKAASSSSSSSSGTTGSSSSAKKQKKKIEYVISQRNETILNNTLFLTTLDIHNDLTAHEFEVWGYVYKGSVSYSGEREANKQQFNLGPDETKSITLENTAVAIEGDYQFKIKIRKDQQKTTTDLTYDVRVDSETPSVPPDLLNFSETEQNSTTSTLVGLAVEPAVQAMLNLTVEQAKPEMAATLVYQSSSAAMKSIIIYGLVAVLALVCIVLVWKG